MRLRKNRDWGLNDETLKNGANTIDAIFLTFISLNPELSKKKKISVIPLKDANIRD